MEHADYALQFFPLQFQSTSQLKTSSAQSKGFEYDDPGRKLGGIWMLFLDSDCQRSGQKTTCMQIHIWQNWLETLSPDSHLAELITNSLGNERQQQYKSRNSFLDTKGKISRGYLSVGCRMEIFFWMLRLGVQENQPVLPVAIFLLSCTLVSQQRIKNAPCML